MVLAVAASLVFSAARAGSAEDDDGRKEAPHYESPLLSLVLLPFNILIRMASVFEQEKPASPARDRTENR